MTLPDYPHQATERAHFGDPGRFLFWPMRVGKTKSTIDLAYDLFSRRKIQAVIVLAPVGAHAAWLDQVAQHAPAGGFARSDGYAWGDWAGTWLQARDAARAGRLAWLCLGKEHVAMDDAWKRAVWMAREFRCLLVVDESHHFRNPTAKRTKRAIALAANCPYRRILSGSPDDNSPMNLWSQLEIVQRGGLGCPTFSSFRDRYAITETAYGSGGREYPKIVGFQRNDELRAKLLSLSSIVREEDVEGLALPEFHRRHFELGAAERAAYDRMRDAMRLEFSDGRTADAVNPAALLVRLQQLASGFIADDIKKLRTFGASRADALAELAEEIGFPDRQLVVWARFSYDIQAARAALQASGARVETLDGDTKLRDRVATREAFARGEVRAIVAHPGCAGEFFDLSAARRMVWYSHTWDAAARRQASARCTALHKEPAIVTDLVGRDTVDEAILGTLGSKRETSEATWVAEVMARALGRWRDPLLD